MTTTAGHSFYIGPISSFYNQVNDTASGLYIFVNYSSFFSDKYAEPTDKEDIYS